MKININDTKFLDRETEIKHKDIVTFISEGIWEDSTKYKKEDGTPSKQFNINLKLANGEIRSTILGWQNIKLLVQAFGDETSSWVNKEVRAWKTKSEKAKSGFIFLYVPTDWDRDDTGEWIIPESSQEMPAIDEVIDYPEDETNLEDIPF